MGTKKTTFTILHTGRTEHDAAMDFRMFGLGTAATPEREATWTSVPLLAVLIEHPDEGLFLLDGGARRGCEYGGGGRDPEDERFTPLYVEEGQWIDENLAALGVKPADLAGVIISTYFWHNVGILDFLAGTRAAKHIYVPADDFGYGITETHITRGEVGFRYRYGDFHIPGVAYTYVRDSVKIADGIRLSVLKGNAPSTIAVTLDTESGPWFFPGAAAPSAAHVGPPIRCPGLAYDSAGFFETAKEVNRLVAESGCGVIYAQDPAQFAQLRLAPEKYE